MFEKINDLIQKGISVELEYVIIQIASTLILFFFVKFFLWKPITNFLEKKNQIMLDNIKQAQEQKEKTISLQKEAQEEYDNAKAESKRIIREAIELAEQEKKDMLQETKLLVKEKIQEANQDIENLKEAAREELEEIAYSKAIEIASKIIEKEIKE